MKIVNKVEKELNTFTQWGFSTMPTPEGNGFLVGAQLQSKAGDMLELKILCLMIHYLVDFRYYLMRF